MNGFANFVKIILSMKKITYQCVDCGKTYVSDNVMYLCPDCNHKNKPDSPPFGVLKTVYDYTSVKNKFKENIFLKLEQHAFIDILPVEDINSLPFLRVGQTPLYKIDTLSSEIVDCQLYLKDDSQNPTFSFKDRASAVVSAYAKEHDIDTIVAASTGNAGSSLAGMCAAQGQKAIIFVPATAPKAKLTQILMYGAQIVPVAGTYDNAFDLSVELTMKYGFYNRNTAFNPLTIEGKKTVSLELYSQLNQHIPDKIFVPVGDGVIISGVYKGFEDLLMLGIIDKMPIIVAVQAENSSNIIQNLSSETFVSHPSKTIADSISVDIPRNFRMTKKFLSHYYGESVMVSDREILLASQTLSRNTGIFSEPAASASFAGFMSYYKNGKINQGEKVVVLLTGSGLKDLNAVQSLIQIPTAIEPHLTAVEKFLNM
jgi:threonine synthase